VVFRSKYQTNCEKFTKLKQEALMSLFDKKHEASNEKDLHITSAIWWAGDILLRFNADTSSLLDYITFISKYWYNKSTRSVHLKQNTAKLTKNTHAHRHKTQPICNRKPSSWVNS